MFINLSNHPSENWQPNQYTSAEKYGKVIDIPFPQIDTTITEKQINELVKEYRSKILNMKPSAILVGGEFTFTYQLVNALLQENINVIIPVSERKTIERKLPNGTIEKIAKFNFKGWRKYENFYI